MVGGNPIVEVLIVQATPGPVRGGGGGDLMFWLRRRKGRSVL